MKKFNIIYFIVIILIFIIVIKINAEDYQYQFFNNKQKHVPFSDYIPRVRLHYKTVPHYLEDFYMLYGMKQYYNENSLRKNINNLKKALGSKFRHPSQALIKIETQQEYLKYRRLMFMHINILILKNYLRIASKYDKKKIYFYNLDFSKEIMESLSIAEKLNKKAILYWERAKKHAINASKIKLTTDLGFIESERYSIIKGNLNYKKIIKNHLKRIKEKKKILGSVATSMR